ncbi:MAG: SDR family oxidoreductase [Gemmatimonadota bacterium]
MALSPEPAGRLAVVTGGGGGLARATAVRLAAAGVEVVVVARNAAGVRAAADDTGCTGIAADVSTEAGVARVAAALAGRTPDIIVHAAGAFQLAPLTETSVESFDTIIAVNLRAAFLLARAFVPAMRARGAGDIVLIGSVAGRHAFPSNGAYSASKFGLRGMHAVLATELRGSGVRAVLVEPAATDTALWTTIDRAANPELPDSTAMLEPDAVAEAVLFAISRAGDVLIPNIIIERA